MATPIIAKLRRQARVELRHGCGLVFQDEEMMEAAEFLRKAMWKPPQA